MIAALAAARLFLKGVPREIWYLLAAAAALLMLWGWHGGTVRAAARAATATERGAWEAEAARLRAIAADEAARRLAAVAGADATARAVTAAITNLTAAERTKADAYYRTNPGRNVPCLGDERLRAIAQADAAAATAAATR